MLSLEQLQALQIRAIQHGAKVNYHTDSYGKPSTVEWDISGRCERPAVVELVARQGVRVLSVTRKHLCRFRAATSGFARLILHTVCRKCSTCRRKRQRMWYLRSKQEYEAASRNWFGTLTLSPEEHFLCETRIRAYLDRQGVDFEALPAPEQFQLRVKEAGKHVTLWLKRVRKNSGARIRYLMVCEAHKSGLPHFHVLIHEQGIEHPVRWQVLSDAWEVGFSQFKLAKEPKAALYLTKYLTKAMDVRVRASCDYGKNHRLDDTFCDAKKGGTHRPKHQNLQQNRHARGSLLNVCETTLTEELVDYGQSISDYVGSVGLSDCAKTDGSQPSPSGGSSGPKAKPWDPATRSACNTAEARARAAAVTDKPGAEAAAGLQSAPAGSSARPPGS